MLLDDALTTEFRDSARAARECADAAAFAAAFVFPVALPIATWAIVEMAKPMELLAADPARPDYASRSTLSTNRVAPVDLPESEVVAVAEGFDLGRRDVGPRDARRLGLRALFGAVAAEEAVQWLNAALRALERAAAAPETATSHFRAMRRIEAMQYLRGAGPWLRVTHVDDLANWIPNNSPRLEKERQRVLAWKGNGVPLRDLIRDNLRGHRIAPLDAATVASVFTRRSAAEVAEAFVNPPQDPQQTSQAFREAGQRFGTLGNMLVPLSAPWMDLVKPN